VIEAGLVAVREEQRRDQGVGDVRPAAGTERDVVDARRLRVDLELGYQVAARQIIDP